MTEIFSKESLPKKSPGRKYLKEISLVWPNQSKKLYVESSAEEVSLTTFQWAQIEGNEFVHVTWIEVEND